ncbi:hypothetical protein E3N88_41039 [Mikania micrantha]|uniref:non-specific serine/threonine protein kinase n=1 Tax=Mikania micrantha TaxID=192012 RepID=A0A5N6LP99_9ASTR|nr:hypothetical protein E3N88_41039 [Mikania micrantha]
MPTMTEIVAGLEFVLALQEKANKTLVGGGMMIFGRRVPMFVFPSNGKSSVESGSSNSLKLFSDIVGDESRIPYQFDYDTIRVATNDFSDAKIIPQSAFASMYKGKLENGQRIGIARPYTGSACRSSKDVLSLLVLLRHENLLKLIGYYIKEATPFFVFELAAKGSLDRFIHPYSIVLGWNERYKIILGVARVLLYLHKHSPHQIIHGDVKPENILLDKSFEPKLSDFRFARCLINNTVSIDTYVIHCTTEYMAPEYKWHGRLSTKSDVFSFGMLILKTISGCRTYSDIPAANKNFLQYNYYNENKKRVLTLFCHKYRLLNCLSLDPIDPTKIAHLTGLEPWTNWWTGTYSDIVDPRIDADSTSIRRFIHIGLLCTQPDPIDRPTMEDVNGLLLGSSFLTLPVPKFSVSPQITEEESACTNGQEALTINYDLETVEEVVLELEPR